MLQAEGTSIDLMEGIPDQQDQARIHQFNTIEALLTAFKKIFLSGRADNPTTSTSNPKLMRTSGKREKEEINRRRRLVSPLLFPLDVIIVGRRDIFPLLASSLGEQTERAIGVNRL